MKKIMFNDRYGLTQAVIEGRKTMTRRIVPTKTRLRRALAVIHDEPHGSEQEEYLKSACYKVGEIVAVAQNYRSCGNYHVPKEHPGWSNKLFVLPALMPYQIRITRIKCERLQDISDEECLREGIRQFTPNFPKNFPIYPTHFVIGDILKDTPRKAFAALIDKVSGRGTWASNPWVVAYEFELVK